VEVEYDENYNLYIENKQDEPSDWRLVSLRDEVLKISNIEIGATAQQSAANAKAVWGDHWKVIRYQLMAKFALENADKVVSVRDPHKPTTKLKTALSNSKNNPSKVVVFKKSGDDEELNEDEKNEAYLYNGGSLSFYSNKVVEIDGVQSPSVLLTDFWSDLSWDGIAKEGGVKLKNGKKPERLLKRIIEICTDNPTDIVLDFHLGSGTTAAVAHKMGRQYIGIEQLDYGQNDSVVRLQNVIGRKIKKDGQLLDELEYDSGGISKAVNWQGGGDFVYAELLPYNEAFIDRILSAKSRAELLKLYRAIAKDSFLNWYVNDEYPEKAIADFEAIGDEDDGLFKQKNVLCELLDKNQLYVNLSEIRDTQFGVSKEDQALNAAFYKES
jgi:adenine-specific DNA-methyltransferase